MSLSSAFADCMAGSWVRCLKRSRAAALCLVAALLAAAFPAAADLVLVSWGEQVVPVGFDHELFMQVAAGRHHSLGLRGDNTVVAWGRNNQRQCDVPSGLSNVVQVTAGDWYSLALKSDGSVVGWGSTNYAVLPVPAGLTNIQAISAGPYHAIAVRRDGDRKRKNQKIHRRVFF